MSIDLDIFRKAGVDTEQDERAQRAVKAFRALQPTLSAYARILTGRPTIQVELAARDNGSTDGKKIFFRPPIALGDNTLHERRLCDKRDSDKQLLCAACAVREGVLSTIYHEIAHNCYDSFEQTSDADRSALISMAIREVDGKYAAAITAKIDNSPSWMKDSYISMASLISEFLPIIVNALEDARVNSQLFKARKGTRVMFDADVRKTFKEGVEQKDAAGNIIIKPWNEYPLNMQAIVGLFCKASGYDYTDWFVTEAVEALNDATITELVTQSGNAHSAADVYHLSFPVLTRLRELGFCKSAMDPKVEGEEEDEPEEQDETEESSDEDSGEENGEECENGAPSDQAGDSEPDDSTEASDDASSESEADGGKGKSPDSTGKGSGEGENDADTSPTGKGAASKEEDSSDRDDQSSSDDDKDGLSDDDDSEDISDGGNDKRDDKSDRGEDGNSDTTGDSDSQSDQSGDAGGTGDSESTGSGSPSRSPQNDSEESGDLSADAQGASKGDSESDVSEASTRDESAGGGTDEAGNSDSDSSGRSGDTSESVDSDDNLDSAVPDDDVSADKEAGTEDVDLAGSDDSSARQDANGDDLDGVQESSTEEKEGNGDAGEDDSTEPIDTGADDGQGGTEIIENKKNDHLPMGTAEDCKEGLLKWNNHEEKPKSVEEGEYEDAVDRAIIQGIYFETPSRSIWGVRMHHFGQPVMVEGRNMSTGWDESHYTRSYSWTSGVNGNFKPTEKTQGPALLRMRVAFADNKRGKEIRNMKSGKVDARVLGRRAPAGDVRLFKKKIAPGKKDYFVAIGMDISGSTVGTNLVLEKRAIMAQADLLRRMGIPFAIFAHSGNYHSPEAGRYDGLDLDVYLIKDEHEPWDNKTQVRLEKIGSDSANLDGHAMEFLRKQLDKSNATDKIIMYYSDGKMPAENHDEELVILQREIKLCARKGYVVMGVGIRTDSPARHGLPTVQVDEDEDIVKVIKHLEGALR